MTRDPSGSTAVQYRSMTPADYQTYHRHEDAIRILTEHRQGRSKTVCTCGTPMPDGWAAHMADVLYPLNQRLAD